jgi:hypothetical protein
MSQVEKTQKYLLELIKKTEDHSIRWSKLADTAFGTAKQVGNEYIGITIQQIRPRIPLSRNFVLQVRAGVDPKSSEVVLSIDTQDQTHSSYAELVEGLFVTIQKMTQEVGVDALGRFLNRYEH